MTGTATMAATMTTASMAPAAMSATVTTPMAPAAITAAHANIHIDVCVGPDIGGR